MNAMRLLTLISSKEFIQFVNVIVLYIFKTFYYSTKMRLKGYYLVFLKNKITIS